MRTVVCNTCGFLIIGMVKACPEHPDAPRRGLDISFERDLVVDTSRPDFGITYLSVLTGCYHAISHVDALMWLSRCLKSPLKVINHPES